MKSQRQYQLQDVLSLVIPLSMAAFFALSLTNCSGVKFTHSSGNSQSGVDGSVGAAGGGAGAGLQPNNPGSATTPGISNAGGPPGPVTGTGNTSPSLLPKVQFIAPPCMRDTMCSVTFQLDKAYPNQTQFHWQTDDSLYGTPPKTGLAPWGQPNVQYVSTSGIVVFPPGQTSETVYVRNINPQNTAITIGVLMTNCAYATLLESCQSFFTF